MALVEGRYDGCKVDVVIQRATRGAPSEATLVRRSSLFVFVEYYARLNGTRWHQSSGAPGPFVGLVLAHNGASVIRIDRPSSTSHDLLCAGKRLIALDVKTSGGLRVAELIAKAGVLIDPFRSGVLEKLGLGPEVFHTSDKREGQSDRLLVQREQGSQGMRGHADSVYSVAFMCDGRGLVTGSLDKTLKYWDINDVAARRKELATDGKKDDKSSPCTMNFLGHPDYVLSVAVSHDGQWVVSGSKDHGVRF
ncbi:hypothetical protein AZE42_10548 [Rhizopogon vesiculosus]|uniref:Uncharacterized protein n=1 Tax=Rhizopogon vesiculosus TaxID=180088 RepID=A0A1J8QMY0_9AGAM|nr:hypothetical protein AZE42_10548 [Rhizopogon vesiculosus]